MKIHTQLNIYFIMLMNVKMPTIVGILTFISMINTASGNFHLQFSAFQFYEELEFYAQLS